MVEIKLVSCSDVSEHIFKCINIMIGSGYEQSCVKKCKDWRKVFSYAWLPLEKVSWKKMSNDYVKTLPEVDTPWTATIHPCNGVHYGYLLKVISAKIFLKTVDFVSFLSSDSSVHHCFQWKVFFIRLLCTDWCGCYQTLHILHESHWVKIELVWSIYPLKGRCQKMVFLRPFNGKGNAHYLKM